MGKGEIAEKILETAKENAVPVFQDAKLATYLKQIKLR